MSWGGRGALPPRADQRPWHPEQEADGCLHGSFAGRGDGTVRLKTGHRENEQLSPPSPVLLLRKGQNDYRGNWLRMRTTLWSPVL